MYKCLLLSVICRKGFHLWQIAEAIENHLLRLKYRYVSYENARIC